MQSGLPRYGGAQMCSAARLSFGVWAGVRLAGPQRSWPSASILWYAVLMKEALENLIERVAALPKEAQEEVVRSLVEIEQRHTGLYQLDDEERADLLEALAEVARGEVATDDEAAALFKRLGAA
jgi:hypothetical protein